MELWTRGDHKVEARNSVEALPMWIAAKPTHRIKLLSHAFSETTLV